MPTIKIYPPAKLPDRGVTETQFAIWCEELEVYLAQENNFAQFLQDGRYSTWISKEVNPDRIVELNAEDLADPHLNTHAARNAKLRSVRTQLRTVLSIIGKCVSEGHYNTVVRHSTSLQWVYNTLRCDYDIQQKGVHFLNILDVKYDATIATPISFYNEYRTVIVNNLAKRGDVIKYKNNLELEADEKMSPMVEDLILLNVLREIDPRLPAYVKLHYNHKMRPEDKLMDFKSDMLINVSTFLEHLNSDEQNQSIKVASLNTFKQQRPFRRNKQTFNKQNKKYCRLCFLENLPREIFTSHDFGDRACTSISKQDRYKMNDKSRLANIKDNDNIEYDDDEIAEMFGYSGNLAAETSTEEVIDNFGNKSLQLNLYRTMTKNSFIQPVKSQILTVFEHFNDTSPVHIDLDSGATLNYCEEGEVLRRGFKMYPNNQLSKLGDGITNIKAIGEIRVAFFRNKRKIIYNAVVCKSLNSPFIGGTLFLKDNNIEQDFTKNVIHMFDRSYCPTYRPCLYLAFTTYCILAAGK